MDIISSRAINITELALNGLMERQKAISSNTANVMTPNYQRKEVSFENQLAEIISKDEIRKDLRAYNGMLQPNNAYNQTIPNEGFIPSQAQQKGLPAEQLKFLSQKDYNTFNPEIIRDTSEFDPASGNNVDMEKEMMDMAKNGMKYSVLANLEGKMFSGLDEIIKSGNGVN